MDDLADLLTASLNLILLDHALGANEVDNSLFKNRLLTLLHYTAVN